MDFPMGMQKAVEEEQEAMVAVEELPMDLAAVDHQVALVVDVEEEAAEEEVAEEVALGEEEEASAGINESNPETDYESPFGILIP